MNHKARIYQLCDYILSQDHERDYIASILNSCLKTHTRKELRQEAENSVWYSAMVLLYGRAEARKEVTELINEIKGERY